MSLSAVPGPRWAARGPGWFALLGAASRGAGALDRLVRDRRLRGLVVADLGRRLRDRLHDGRTRGAHDPLAALDELADPLVREVAGAGGRVQRGGNLPGLRAGSHDYSFSVGPLRRVRGRRGFAVSPDCSSTSDCFGTAGSAVSSAARAFSRRNVS